MVTDPEVLNQIRAKLLPGQEIARLQRALDAANAKLDEIHRLAAR